MDFLFTLLSFLHPAFACAATLLLAAVGVNSIFASALVTALYCVAAGRSARYAAPVFCGSFSGMSSFKYMLLFDHATISSGPHVLLLSVLTGLVFLAVDMLTERFPQHSFAGFGGKLGATAFIATLLYSVMAHAALNIPYDHRFPTALIDSRISFAEVFVVSALAGTGGAAMPLLLHGKALWTMSARDRVVLTAWYGLVGSSIFFLFPSIGSLLAATWYSGNFVSMSSGKVMPAAWHLAVAGALSGTLFLITLPLFYGLGGALGFCALLSVFLVSTCTTRA